MNKKAIVYFDKSRNKYRVQFGRGQKLHFGRYNTEKEAMIAKRAIEKSYGMGFSDGVNHCLKKVHEVMR